MNKQILATGIFSWDGQERRSNRYGSFFLETQNCEETATATQHYDLNALHALAGKRVSCWCRIVEARKSGHIGDMFLGVFPRMPQAGEEILVGVGVLGVVPNWDGSLAHPALVLAPEDGRDELWIDPRVLYRLHDQTVELYMEETAQPCTQVMPFLRLDDKGVEDLGDGTFQAKKVPLPMHIPPDVEILGDGLFRLSPYVSRKGRRFGGERTDE